VQLPIDAACIAAGEDGEFRVASRFWDATVAFVAGDTRHVVAVKDGSARAVASSEVSAPDVTIRATPESWEKMLAPVPEPFYHDLFAATQWHGVKFEGAALEEIGPYYPALRRFVELMREANQHATV
jgi:hypothetical protein